MVAKMKSVATASRPTLDRLKALSSQSDLKTQLQEAKQLCTHGVRADMVAKWLLEQLKSSEKARTTVETWTTLCSTFRMLSPERLAALLSPLMQAKPLSFLDIATSALRSSNNSTDLLVVIAELFNLLLELCTSPQGAPIKAALSVSADRASVFLGEWLASVYAATSASSGIALQHSVSSPATEIWELRKPSAEDNAHFASNALVPACRCLSLVSQDPKSAQNPKRKRGESHASKIVDFKAFLTPLLARHVFLPARIAFLQAESSLASQSKIANDSSKSQIQISELVKPLKDSINLPEKPDQALLGSLPALLNIALQCSPAATPRQRVSEQPWVETVALVLHDCNLSSNGMVLDRRALLNMLAILGSRGKSLSVERLKALLDQQTNLGQNSSERPVDWEMIARIIDLDANMFTETERLQMLCTGVTAECFKANSGEKIVHLPINDTDQANTTTAWTFLKDQIIGPLVDASSKGRNLEAFIETWWSQLQHDNHNQARSVWMDIDGQIQGHLSDALTTNQLVGLVDRFAGPLRESSNTSSTSQEEVDASIVVLNAILGGINAQSTLDAVQPKLEQILTDVLTIAGAPSKRSKSKPSPASTGVRTFALARQAFELWFPAWAIQQGDIEVIAQKAKLLLDSEALKSARQLSDKFDLTIDACDPSNEAAFNAQLFISGICSRLHGYDQEGCAASCAKLLSKSFKTSGPPHANAVVQYPEVLSLISQEQRQDFLEHCVDATIESSWDRFCHSQLLPSIAEGATRQGRTAIIEDLVELALGNLAGTGPRTKERAVLDFLLRIPATSLSRTQREALLNRVTELQCSVLALDRDHFFTRLAFLVHLMRAPNATSRLATEVTCLWQLAESISAAAEEFRQLDDRMNDQAGPANVVRDDSRPRHLSDGYTTAFALLEELSTSTLRHLLATQDQERNRLMLLGLYEYGWNKGTLIEFSPGPLTLMKSIIRELEKGAREDLLTQLPHRRDSEAAESLLKSIWQALYDPICSLKESQEDPRGVLVSLNALIDVTDSVGGQVGRACRHALERVLGEVRAAIDATKAGPAALGDDQTAEGDRFFSSTEVKAMALGCRSDPDDSDVLHTLSLVHHQLEPRDIEVVFSAWAQKLARSGSGAYLECAQQLLVRETGSVASKLLMAQNILSRSGPSDPEDKAQRYYAQQLIQELLDIVIETKDWASCRRALHCVTLVLKDSPRLVNQHNVEMILNTLHRLSRRRSLPSLVYLDTCNVVSTILLHHRSRLQGRFHLVIQLLQALLSRQFPSSDIRRATPPALSPQLYTAKHAQAFARLLTLFCEPPQSRRPGKTSDLVDQARKEQAHVGQYVPYLLHQYCAEVLAGVPVAEGVREALQPGLWAVCQAMEVLDVESVKGLSAAMDNNERAVLRGVWEDYQRFGKWRGG